MHEYTGKIKHKFLVKTNKQEEVLILYLDTEETSVEVLILPSMLRTCQINFQVDMKIKVVGTIRRTFRHGMIFISADSIEEFYVENQLNSIKSKLITFFTTISQTLQEVF